MKKWPVSSPAVYKVNKYYEGAKKKETIMSLAAYHAYMFSLYEIDKYRK
jgi:hypothetical protein